MKKFFTRATTGLIYAAVMLFCFYYNASPWYIIGLALFFIYICTRELFNISKHIFKNHHFSIPDFILAIAGSILLLSAILTHDPLFILGLIIIPVILMTRVVVSRSDVAVPAGTALISIVYIGIPIALLTEMKFVSYILPIAMLCMIWINDTMAYITGSLIGKTPLSSISPKKTIEGTAGGVLFTVLFAGLFGYFYRDAYFGVWFWMGMATIVGIFGNIGDLFESYLKRKAGIKDSGNLLPGHGGFLDRLDSLLLCTPIVAAYIMGMKLISVL